MTVKELIRQLKGYNPQARVIVNYGDGNDDWSYLYNVAWSIEEGKTNKNLVKLR